MANENGWGDGASNNANGWGQGSNNATGWGISQTTSWSGLVNIKGLSTSNVDVDAQAFITAAAITDATQQSAIDTLVTGLKTDGLWTKMKAIYPFVGGTATSHKYNLKDPRDLDAAFRLSFFGGWTHSATGALPNGTNAYANSFLTPLTSLGLNSTHISYYSRTSGARGYLFGVNDVSLTNRLLWQIQSGINNYLGTYAISANYFEYTSVNSLSMLMVNRTASNISNAWQGGVKKITSAFPSVALTTLPLFIGANNNEGAFAVCSNAQCAFSSIGNGLTDTEAANLYTRVQAFQTTLSRQV